MKQIPLIIDTDPGIDDAVAIALAVFNPRFDVRLITTVAGNVSIEATTTNALKLMAYYGKDVPVARGAAEPLIRQLDDASDIHGKTGMEGFDFPEPKTELLLDKHAVEAMHDEIMASAEPVTVMPIGPLTNIALLLKTFPEVKSRIERIVLMGGSVTRGNKGVMAEFNIFVDPEGGCGRKVGRLGVRIGVRMFSMEDRRRAVDLYFTEGMTIRKVIAELGYPSEGALVKWVREDPRYTGACRRSYTLECKTNAARRALEGEPLARVARDAGCTPTSVYQWMRRYRSEGILGLMDRRNAPMPAEPMPAAGDDVEELRRQVEVLRLENAVMRETIDVLKADDPRLDPSMLTNRERTRVVDAIRGEFGLAACLKAVGLKRSTYYYERGAIAAGDRYAVLRARVAGLFEQGGRAWGYRTIHRMLRLDESDPIVVSEKVVRRIMREGAMRPVYLKRPKRWSSYAGEIGEAPANLVERDFHADAPNMLWVTDVTQFTMDGYKCWLSPVVDCFDGMVVSWTLSRSPNADMANRMLLDAVATLRDGEHPIIHSD